MWLFVMVSHQLTSSWSLNVTRQMYIQQRESRDTKRTTENPQQACCNNTDGRMKIKTKKYLICICQCVCACVKYVKVITIWTISTFFTVWPMFYPDSETWGGASWSHCFPTFSAPFYNPVSHKSVISLLGPVSFFTGTQVDFVQLNLNFYFQYFFNAKINNINI